MRDNGKSEQEVDFYTIDKYRLDVEWECQPKLFHQYAMILANRNADYERAKANEKLVWAEVEQEFRLSKADDAKGPTEAAVKAAVLTSSRYKDAVEATIQSGHDADVAKVAVDTVGHHRKPALENEVQLFLANYYSRPKSPKGDEVQVDLLKKKKIRNPES